MPQPTEVGWLDSRLFDSHLVNPGHPECPARLPAVREALAARNLSDRLVHREATAVDLALLGQVHPLPYIQAVAQFCAGGGGALEADTVVCRASYTAALHAAGAVVQGVEEVLAGRWHRAFCSVRPPGHHAAPAQAMGFCLFDNVAVGAQAALLHPGVTRVAILDWDVHHGNGTQDIFWQRSDVLFASMHQYPFYPGTGAVEETGAGQGAGTTVNCPIPRGGGVTDYWHAWDTRIRPALEAYAPHMLFISAGFDADARDPLGQLEMTPQGFAQLSAAVVRWADVHCNGRVVSVLEGGYNLTALGEDVALHVETLL